VNLTDFADEELIRLKRETELKLRRNLPFKIKIDKYVLTKIYIIKARFVQLGFMGAMKKAVKKVMGLNKS
jgi:hypothetical protein